MSAIERISEHIWIMHAEHKTDRPILAAICGTKRTLLMDAGNSPVHATLFREELAKHGVRLPDLLVLTHWHWDHTFGMSEWELPTIAQEETATGLRRLKGLDGSDEILERLVQEKILSEETVGHIKLEYGTERNITIMEPDIIFKDSITIELGRVTCEVKWVGGDHTSDACYVYVQQDQVLFLGDALGPSVYGGPRSYTAPAFLRLLGEAYSYEAKVFVESHGRPMEREAFIQDLNEWEQLARLVEKYGGDRERIAEELTAWLKVEELSKDLKRGLEYFMAGLGRGE
ncbi:MBL fold metallo-hydrolase [Brevibacillus ginsengisoli]|uniref:MBL fold metallo-hydrolase n=1 Tax=Brevibacillus ginsengisoli TaxID=363854 RepID=UPI003CEB76C2